MQSVKNRFLKYVLFDTQSNPDSKNFPSTESQLGFAKTLAYECNNIGLKNISLDKNGYVMAELPANDNSLVSKEKIGFIAHMDTAPEFSAKNVSPQVVKDYDGRDIFLCEDKVLSPIDFPDLKKYIGQDLIVTDGKTLLGADDKAGIAEIMTAMEFLIKHDEIKHGTIKIAFTPDEEIGRGAEKFDTKKFDCDFAYTVDGGEIGELNYENFNAAVAKIIIYGRSVHPGSAKNIMINSILTANKIINEFPDNQTPETTDGREGFYHLHKFMGTVSKSELEYIIRDFDKKNFEARKLFIRDTVKKVIRETSSNIDLDIRDQYFNMREKISEDIISRARYAFEKSGVKPIELPIRGGTDGASLSFKNLPCPNIFTGGHNFHGPYEFISIHSMIKSTEVIVNMCSLATF